MLKILKFTYSFTNFCFDSLFDKQEVSDSCICYSQSLKSSYWTSARMNFSAWNGFKEEGTYVVFARDNFRIFQLEGGNITLERKYYRDYL